MRSRSLNGACALMVCTLCALAGCADDGPRDGTPGTVQTSGAPATQGEPAPKAACASTWQAIQQSIFAAKGCASATCHSRETRAGSLDLSGVEAHHALVNRPASASLSRPLPLVTPGDQSLSFLYLKLAAATEGHALPTGGGAPMPVGQAPLTSEQLAAVRAWIRAGAPATGVVAGTQDLLSCTAGAEAEPNKSPRPPVPAPEAGFQHVAGPWTVKPGTESEVCFATYYDLSRSAPPWARMRCKIGSKTEEEECVAYDRRELSQDAQSHHSIIQVYAGAFRPLDPSQRWGKWRCASGELAGTACDPTQLGVSARDGGAECGADAVCQTEPFASPLCVGFGPPDRESLSGRAGGAQAPVALHALPSGVYDNLPIRGVVVWNSHAFNLTKKDATVEQYNTFWYAPREKQTYRMITIHNPGSVETNSIIYDAIDVPPFQSREYCGLYVMPRYSRLFQISAHAHKRMVLWRTWLPPNEARCPEGGCRPNEREPDYRSTQYNDPVIKYFDPPVVFDSERPEERTLKFCGVYDNGKERPDLLKRKSQLIQGASCARRSRLPGVGYRTGPLEPTQLYCVGGDRQGQPCSGDAECTGGGACDACVVNYGDTTEDEMFYLMGNFFVVPPSSASGTDR